jgi:hypothetical protein
MKDHTKRRLRWSLILGYGICTLMLLAVTIGYLLRPPFSVISKLEQAVSRIPLGVDVIDADMLMGGTPHEITTVRGVMMNSATMLTEDNSLASNHGPAQNYSLRIWRDNCSGATVVIDEQGQVAGHWGWTNED